MSENEKTKDQLLGEIQTLQQKIIELEGERAAHYEIEGELRSLQERLNVIFDLAPDAYYINDLSGNFIDGSRAAESVIGYKREELIGKSFLKLNLLPLEELPRAAKNLAQNVLGKPTGPDEFTLIRKDGRRAPIEVRTMPTTLGGQKVVLGIARDITERKKLEQELRQSNERFQSMFTSMTEGVALHELAFDEKGKAVDYRILDVNPAYQTQTGIKRKDAIGKLASELYGTGSPPYFEIYQHVAISGEPTNFETFFAPMQKHFSISVFSPGVNQFVTVFRDITIEKRVEEEIRKLSRAVDQSPSLIIIMDTSEHIEYVNSMFCEVTGYMPEEVIGKNPSFLRSGETPEEELQEMRQNLLSGKSWRGEIQNKKKNGELFWASVMITPIRDENNVITHFLAVEQDITERVRSEERIRESEEKYKEIVEMAPDGILTLDLKGRITSANPAFSELSGYPTEEIINRPFTKLPTLAMKDIPKYLKTFQSLMQGAGGEPVEFVWTHKDGTTREGEARVSVIRRSGKVAGLQVIARDITERKRYEDELKKRLKEQTELREAAGILSSTLDLDDVLTRIVEIMGRSVDATSAYINSCDLKKMTSTVMVNYHGPRVHEKELVSVDTKIIHGRLL